MTVGPERGARSHANDMNERDREGSDAAALISVGSEMAGNVAGVAIGFLAAGPVGAIAGAASGPAFTHIFEKIGAEVGRRFLSHREQVRAGAALSFAIQKVKENFDAGMAPREDGFFTTSVDDRSSADEIVEGALLVAQREHEEKKVRFVGYLLGNIPFVPGIDRGTANLWLSLADRLSYRQLVLLRLFADSDRHSLREGSYRDSGSLNANQIAAIQEAYGLDALGMVSTGQAALLGPADVMPSKMRPQGIGAHLHRMMELSRIDPDDLEQVARLLR